MEALDIEELGVDLKRLLAGRSEGLLATCQLHPLLLPSGVHTVTTDTVDSHDWQLCKCARRSANMTANKTSTWDIWVAARRWHHLVCSSSRDGKEVPCRRRSHPSPSHRLTRGEAGHTWEGHQTLILANWSQLIGKLPIQAVECWLVSEGYGADGDSAADEPRGCSRNEGSPVCEEQRCAAPAETERWQKTWIMFIDVTASCCVASGLTTHPRCGYSVMTAGVPFNQLGYFVTKYVKSPEKTWRNVSSNKSN